MHRFLILLLLTLSLSAPAWADTPLPLDPRVTMETLPNGLKVIYRQVHKPENRINVRLVFRAGSLYENAGEEGLAHFLEHMVFQGGGHFPPGEMEKWLRKIGAPLGGDSNASTGWTRTNYYLRLKTGPQEVKEGLQFFQDILTGPVFPQEKIDLERGVVLEEKRLRRGMDTRWWEMFAKLTLDGTQYPNRFPIGLSESIQKMNREHFIAFHQRLYHPEIAYAVLVGDMPVDQMKALVAETLAMVPKPQTPKPDLAPTIVPTWDAPKSGVITDPEIIKSSFSIVWVKQRNPVQTVEVWRKAVMNQMVMDILEERLSRLALSKKAPFLEPGTWLGTWMKDVTFVTIGADSKKIGKEKEAAKAVIEELDRVLTHGFLQEELEEQFRTKEEYWRQRIKAADTRDADTIAGDLEDAEENLTTPRSEEQSLALLLDLKASMTIEELNATAKRLLGNPNPLVLLEFPEKEKERFQPKKWLSYYQKEIKKKPKPYALPKLVKKVNYAKLKPGKIKHKKHLKDVDAEYFELGNGLKVYLKKTDFDKNWLSLKASFDTTPMDVPPALWDIQGFAAAARTAGGTKEFSADEIARLTKGKTLSVGFGPGGFSGTGAPKYFEEMLQWLHDYLTRPAFREEALKALRTSLAENILQARLDQEIAFDRAVSTLACPGPLSWNTDDPDYYAKFTPKVLKKFIKTAYPTENGTVSIVGDIDIKKTRKLIAKYLGSLPKVPLPDTPEELRICRAEEGQTRHTLYKGKEDRTMVRFILPNAGYDEIHDVAALAAASSAFTLRLKDRLREELGQAYYAYMYCNVNTRVKENSRCQIEFTVPWNQVDTAIAETRNELRKLAEEGLTQKELDEVKLARQKNHDEQIKENTYWINLVFDDVSFRKVPVNFWQEHRDRVQKVTLEQVKAAAAKYWMGYQEIVAVTTGEMNAPKK